MTRHRSQLVVVAERQISLGGRVFPYIVKRSSQARHVRLEIKDGIGLTVVIPRSYKLDSLDEMLRSKSRWILDKMDRHVRAAPLSGKRELRFGDTVPYLGCELRIVSCQGIGGSTESIELQGHTLLVYQDVRPSGLDSLVEQWYRIRAAAVLKQKVNEVAPVFGISYKRLAIRGQKTRWASCSHRGTLSFNWRLLMAPEPVVDYVVIHEVAHLKEMNHTKRFWKLVAEHCPSWREQKEWLDDHGPELTARLSSIH